MTTRAAQSCFAIVLGAIALFMPLATHATGPDKPALHAVQSTFYRYVYYLGWALTDEVVSPGSCTAPPPSFADYAGDMAGFFGKDVRLVSVSPVTGQGTQRTCVMNCRSAAGAAAFRVEVTAHAATGGRIASLAFDRDVTLLRGGQFRAGEQIPLETIMRAIMLSRAARAADNTAGLAVKKFKSKTSCKAPDATDIMGTRMVVGSIPTPAENMLNIDSFTIGTFAPGDTNMALHTFPCYRVGVLGGKNTKYSVRFYLVFSNTVIPDDRKDPFIGTFKAKISKGRLFFTYKDWIVNPTNAFTSQQEYEGLQEACKTNELYNGLSYGAVAFGTDTNALYVVSNVVLQVKTSTTGMKFKNARVKK
ncbi:hypothetical protein GX586_10315 [bacterium]|nr:hypothetical protein [bacterium]